MVSLKSLLGQYLIATTTGLNLTSLWIAPGPLWTAPGLLWTAPSQLWIAPSQLWTASGIYNFDCEDDLMNPRKCL